MLLSDATRSKTKICPALHGRPASASIEKLDDALVLEAQALPDAQDWDRAVELANTVFGIEASPLMNAQNVAELAQSLRRGRAALCGTGPRRRSG